MAIVADDVSKVNRFSSDVLVAISLPSRLSIRHLKIVAALSRNKNIQATAQEMNMTRASVTKALRRLESVVPAPVFFRTSNGFELSRFGRQFVGALAKSLHYLDQAEVEVSLISDPKARQPYRFFSKLTHTQISAFMTTVAAGSQTQAASRLKLSQPAVNMALRDMQRNVGTPLLKKHSNRLLVNECGELIFNALQRSFEEIDDFLSLYADATNKIRSRISVGILPLASAILTARVVQKLSQMHTKATITVVEGTYDSLRRALRTGEIDLIIGGLGNASNDHEVSYIPLFDDELVAVVKSGHPTLRRTGFDVKDCQEFDWVVPRKGTPARQALEAAVINHSINLPRNVIETNSLLTMRALLLESDRIGFMTRSQAATDERAGLIRILKKVKLHARLSIGVRLRKDREPSGLLKLLLEQLELPHK